MLGWVWCNLSILHESSASVYQVLYPGASFWKAKQRNCQGQGPLAKWWDVRQLWVQLKQEIRPETTRCKVNPFRKPERHWVSSLIRIGGLNSFYFKFDRNDDGDWQRRFPKDSRCHRLPASAVPVSLEEPMDPARHDWFQQAAGLSCVLPVLPDDTSACGFDSWFCLSFPLEDQSPALNPRWIAGQLNYLT